jgi:hypothetical protein
VDYGRSHKSNKFESNIGFSGCGIAEAILCRRGRSRCEIWVLVVFSVWYVVGSRNSATTVLIWEGTGGPLTDKVQIDGGKSVESDMLPKACP